MGKGNLGEIMFLDKVVVESFISMSTLRLF